MKSSLVNILLVEPDSALAEAAKRVFEPRRRAVVLTVAGGVGQARSAMESETPDIVIAEAILPDGKGLDVLTAGQTRGIVQFPLIILVDQGRQSAGAEAVRAGAFDYTVKTPATFEDLPHIADGVLREWTIRAQHQRAEHSLRQRVELEMIIGAMSKNFVNLAYSEVDWAINEALGTMAVFAGADRSFVFTFTPDGSVMNNTHEWVAPGVPQQISARKNMSAGRFQWWIARMNRLSNVVIPRVADLPPEAMAEQQAFSSMGVKSIAAVPMVSGGWPVGFVGVETVRKEIYWPDESLMLLQLVSDIFANAMERKRSEEALLLASFRSRRLIEASLDPLITVDRDGKIGDVNAAMETMTGLPRQKLLGADLFQCFTDPENARSYHQAVFREGSLRDRELELRHANGSMTPVLYNASVYRDETGQIAGIFIAARDITFRKRAEERLRDYAAFQSVLAVLRGSQPEDAEGKVWQTMLAAAVRHYEFNLAWYGRFVDGKVQPEYRAGAQDVRIEDLDVAIDQSFTPDCPLSTAILRAQPVSHSDLDRDGLPDPWGKFAKQQNYRSCLCMPVIVEGRVEGCVMIFSGRPGAFPQERIERLVMLADEIGSILGERRRRALLQQNLQESQQRLELALTGADLGLWDWNVQTDSLVINQRCASMLGYKIEDIGPSFASWQRLVHPDDAASFRESLQAHLSGQSILFECEYRVQARMGDWRWILDRAKVIERSADGQALRVAGTHLDITDRKGVEQQLEYKALHDALTGLPNRFVFMDRLRQVVAHKKRRQQCDFAVLFLDLNRFKMINDSLGHAAGDHLLVAIAERLSACLRGNDSIARIGGDEFAILLDDIEHIHDAIRIIDRIQAALAKPIIYEGHELYGGVAIGVAHGSMGLATVEDMLRHADTAMYRAKAAGLPYQLFDGTMHAEALERLELENGLRQGVSQGWFVNHYQPIVDLRTGRIAGFEALLRVNHPDKGLLGPDKFLTIAEETSLIIPIGYQVLVSACRQVSQWNRDFNRPEPFWVSVNMSANQLKRAGFLAKVGEIIAESKIDPRWIRLEVSEDAVAGEGAAMAEIMQKLSQMGVGMFVDDLGTGRSSLCRIHDYDFAGLKIDRKFVGDLETSTKSLALVKAIVAISKHLGVSALAEGVERTSQRDALLDLGCMFGQGYLYCRPGDPADISKFLQKLGGDFLCQPAPN
ncbi:MAG: EAL domain-containing protein [Planctomycetes bacterium]|nr:EAL domain-containing protein [Planctomycetota bacterium]